MKGRAIILLLLTASALASCHERDVTTWYGYRLGGKLDAADILGMPLARNGSRVVALKPRGDWNWDQATALVDPNDIIIALDFEMRGCGPSASAMPAPWFTDTAPLSFQRCARSERDIASFGDALRDSIKDRVSPHTLPAPTTPPSPGLSFARANGLKTYNWSFRKQFSGCDGHQPRYLAPYEDTSSTVDNIALASWPDHLSLIVAIANMAQYDSVRQRIDPIDDDTERQKQEDQCADRHVRYVDIARDTSSRLFGMPQYGYPDANGYRVPPFKRAGVITNQDYDYAAGPGTFEANINWTELTAALDLDAAGTVKRCSITHSSKDTRLDDLSCRLILRRFRFYPARDDGGTPVPSQVTYRLSWPLPRSENGNAWGLDSAYGGSVGAGPP
jgi:hypothetical protein